MKNSKEEVLGGFSALVDAILPPGEGGPGFTDFSEDESESAPVDLDRVDEPIEPPVNEPSGFEESAEPENTESEYDADEQEDYEPVRALFDAISEAAGWGDVDEDEKPKSAEDLISYMSNIVAENSKPKYSSDDVANLDEFVRNGGRIQDYIAASSGELQYSEDDLREESVQKSVLREYLSERGLSEDAIYRKIDTYDDAGILEEESRDAYESLKISNENKKKALLEEQKILHEQQIAAQQKYYQDVVENIEAITDIRGVRIPNEDKARLAEYIFKVESDGTTRYQKDYAKSTRNLIESAYFTMKGDTLIERARKSGETSAAEKLRKTLNTGKIGGSKQRIDTGESTPIWSFASKQLLKKPQ